MNNATISAISPLTGREARPLFRHAVLDKYDAHYFYDDEVGYIFVSGPHWLQEAYSSAIAVTDTGIVMRNARNVDLVGRVLLREKYSFTRGVDLGGGYGLFVRGMRDIGFDFYWTDKYAENLFARGFEAQSIIHSTAAAFEVLEHIENPLAFLRDHQNTYRFDTCFFSATCFDERNMPATDWWYWAFETGQHISFFSERALRWMAAQLGMQLWHIRDDVYAFSSVPWKSQRRVGIERLWNRMRSRVGRRLAGDLPHRRCLTYEDHLALRAKLRQGFNPKS